MSAPALDLSGRIALVTGASRGIGYQLALQMAARGAHVVAVARTIGGVEALYDEIKANHARTGKGEATLVPLDLADMAGIDRLGGAIFERWGRLDILVANAAMLGVISPLGHVEAKVWDKVMALNVTATWRLIRSVDPLIRKSDAGRAIIISSGASYKARPFWGPYAASKAAVDMLGRTWAEELVSTPAKVTLVDPGATRTAMRAQAMPGENPDTLPTAAEVAAAILPLADASNTENGRLFVVREKRFLSFQPPA